MTASSTSAVIRRGVETATSTPHASSNIHSFLGLLTRATVRGTPNSVLASSETTRLTLSSPVAATTTSQLGEAGLLERGDLAGVGEQPLGARARARAGSSSASLSMSSTWWPLCEQLAGDRAARRCRLRR